MGSKDKGGREARKPKKDKKPKPATTSTGQPPIVPPSTRHPEQS